MLKGWKRMHNLEITADELRYLLDLLDETQRILRKMKDPNNPHWEHERSLNSRTNSNVKRKVKKALYREGRMV